MKNCAYCAKQITQTKYLKMRKYCSDTCQRKLKGKKPNPPYVKKQYYSPEELWKKFTKGRLKEQMK